MQYTSGIHETELDEAIAHIKDDLAPLADSRIFITGGTGFLGRWLLALLVRCNETFDLRLQMTCLTRDAERFSRECPNLAQRKNVSFLNGDVRTFVCTDEFTHVIHGATEISADATSRPVELLQTIVEGTERTLELAARVPHCKFLLLSSGMVYGEQPPDLVGIPETFAGGPLPTELKSVYGQGKRLAEQLCTVYRAEHAVEAKIARCFAFAGPHMIVDGHFAIGNFISDAVAGRKIVIKSDGSPIRSYLYPGDTAAWLVKLLQHGRQPAYNVGSDREVSLAELAAIVAREVPTADGLEILGKSDPGKRPARYVPSIDLIRTELNLDVWTSLEESIRRTARWLQARMGLAT